jgi:hypothetical protein
MGSILYRRLERELADKENWIKTAKKNCEKAENEIAKSMWKGAIIEAESTVIAYRNMLKFYGEDEKTAV